MGVSIIPKVLGGMTLLAKTTIDNTVGTYTYSSLGKYKHIFIYGHGLQSSSTLFSGIMLRFNGVSSGNVYGFSGSGNNGASSTTFGSAEVNQLEFGPNILSRNGDTPETRRSNFSLHIPNYRESGLKHIQAMSGGFSGGSSQFDAMQRNGVGVANVGEITSITLLIIQSAITFKAGTIYVYGVN
jgi:hypothetical protein